MKWHGRNIHKKYALDCRIVVMVWSNKSRSVKPWTYTAGHGPGRSFIWGIHEELPCGWYILMSAVKCWMLWFGYTGIFPDLFQICIVSDLWGALATFFHNVYVDFTVYTLKRVPYIIENQNGSCACLNFIIQMVYTFVDLHCMMTSSNGNIFRFNNDLLIYKAPNHNVLWHCTYKMRYWPLVQGIHLFTQLG